MKCIDRLIHVIGQINEWTGRITAYLLFFMALSTTYEVIARYLFNSPTLWSMESNQYVLCLYSALAGGYALLHKAHVSVDIISSRFSEKTRACVDIATSFFFFLFILVLIWKSGVMAWDSLVENEVSPTILEVPLFPVKIFIPIGGFLILLQGVGKLLGDIRVLASDHEVSKDAKGISS